MSTGQMARRVEYVERRVDRVEQIPPTLATREDLEAAIAPLATRAELREVEERLRRHFDVVTESMRDDIRLLAEVVATLAERVRQFRLPYREEG